MTSDDTPPEVADLLHRLLMERSGAERVRMSLDMYRTARRLALAGLRAEGCDDLRVGLFRRFYGADLPPDVLARVEERMRALPPLED